MKKILPLALLITGFFLATNAIGQIYNDKHADILAPMDRVVAEHNATYANVHGAGDEESSASQKDRYTNMIKPLDEAIERDFNTVLNNAAQ